MSAGAIGVGHHARHGHDDDRRHEQRERPPPGTADARVAAQVGPRARRVPPSSVPSKTLNPYEGITLRRAATRREIEGT